MAKLLWRGFCFNDDFLVENLLSETLSFMQLVYDHMYAYDIKLHLIKITFKSLLKHPDKGTKVS